MREFLLEIKKDLLDLNRTSQTHRSKGGDCRTCVSTSSSSVMYAVHKIIRKLEAHMESTNLYLSIKRCVKQSFEAYKEGSLDTKDYLWTKTKVQFYLSEIDKEFRNMDGDEVPDSLCIKVLSKQLENVRKYPTEESEHEESLLLTLLPEEATDETVDLLVKEYLEEHPDARIKTVIDHVLSRVFYSDKAKLSRKIKAFSR